MFYVNDDMSIYLTRGDTAIFSVTADNNGKNYVFQPGDVVRIKVTEKKACENVVFQKDFPVTQATERVDILLTEEETKIGEVISKPTDYWYEIELNPYTNPQTIVGYDDDGAKIFKLFPEGRDLEPTPVDPEDIPVVDNELSLTSDRPVQNQAISRAITGLSEDIKYVRDSGSERMATIEGKLAAEASRRSEDVLRLAEDIAVERARINNLAANTGEQTEGNAELIDVRTGADGTVYETAGEAVRGQIAMLNSEACGVNTRIDLSVFNPSNGVFDATGKYQTNGTYVVTKDIVNVSGFKIITVEPQAGYAYNVAFYDSNDESSFVLIARSSWIEGKHSFLVHDRYIRIQLRNLNGAAEPGDLSTKISVTGIGTIAYNEILNKKREDFGNEAEHHDVYTDFTQGALINGVLSSNASYISSEDFIDVRNYRNIRVKNGEGYKSAVVAYDENKNFLWGTPAITDEEFCVDVSSVEYVKFAVGKDGGLFDGEAVNVSLYFVPDNNHLQQFEVKHQFVFGALAKGVIVNATSRIVTQPFIDVSEYGVLNVSVNENYYYALALYSDKTEAAVKTQYAWSNVNRSFDVSEYKYFRISLRRADNAGMAVSEGANVTIHGVSKEHSENLGIQADSFAKRTYEGNRISLNPTLNYYNVLDFLSSIHESAYPFTEYYQQGAGIHNGYLFMMRHHGACTVLKLSTMEVVGEFLIDDITGNNPHCNSGSFSRVYPSGNAEFPYLYTGRCSYSGDTPDVSTNNRNVCYVLNMTLTGATLAQTIVYENDNTDYTYGAWDWFVDADRNRLVSIGYTKSSALSVRPWIIKEFALPEVEGNAVVTLHDSDVIEQWQIEDNTGGHSLQAFQGCTAYGDYYILPASEPECLAIFNKYTHRLEAYFDLLESEVDEVQCAAVYNGALYLISEGGRIDKVIFD